MRTSGRNHRRRAVLTQPLLPAVPLQALHKNHKGCVTGLQRVQGVAVRQMTRAKELTGVRPVLCGLLLGALPAPPSRPAPGLRLMTSH